MDTILPNEPRSEWVTASSSVEGRPVEVRRFVARTRPEAIAAGWRERWRDTGTAFVESHRGDWLLLSARESDGWRTVQVRASAVGAEGLETRWRDERAARPAASASPVLDWLPPQARVLRRVEHQDPGRDAATVVALVDEDARRAAQRLRARAGVAGFVVDPSVGGPAQNASWFRGRPDGSGEAIALRREREEVVATVAPHPQGTAVVLHWSRGR